MDSERITIGDGSVFIRARKLNSEWTIQPKRLVSPYTSVSKIKVTLTVNGDIMESSVPAAANVAVSIAQPNMKLTVRNVSGHVVVTLLGHGDFETWLPVRGNRIELVSETAHIESVSVDDNVLYTRVEGSKCAVEIKVAIREEEFPIKKQSRAA